MGQQPFGGARLSGEYKDAICREHILVSAFCSDYINSVFDFVLFSKI